jgi:hypothetical protein
MGSDSNSRLSQRRLCRRTDEFAWSIVRRGSGIARSHRAILDLRPSGILDIEAAAGAPSQAGCRVRTVPEQTDTGSSFCFSLIQES